MTHITGIALTTPHDDPDFGRIYSHEALERLVGQRVPITQDGVPTGKFVEVTHFDGNNLYFEGNIEPLV